MIVVDTSFVYALLDGRDRRHQDAAAWYEHVHEEIATTPLVLAEIDHLAAARAGSVALTAFRDDLAAGAYVVDWWPTAPSEIVEIAEQYRDLGVSLADASLVALCGRLETTALATFDERRFRAIRPVAGCAAFTLLPTDVD